jgi:hypothetical protein
MEGDEPLVQRTGDALSVRGPMGHLPNGKIGRHARSAYSKTLDNRTTVRGSVRPWRSVAFIRVCCVS